MGPEKRKKAETLGVEILTEEQAHKMGINDSIIHEDFMIGTSDMSIKGVLSDGSEVDIFRDGEWAFEVS
jgi:aminopeptidase